MRTPFTFQLGTDGYGVFYADGQPRFIFRSIDPMDEVLELHRQVVRTTEMLGYQPPDFTFVPHATLGRVNQDLSDDDMSAVRKFTARMRFIFRSDDSEIPSTVWGQPQATACFHWLLCTQAGE